MESTESTSSHHQSQQSIRNPMGVQRSTTCALRNQLRIQVRHGEASLWPLRQVYSGDWSAKSDHYFGRFEWQLVEEDRVKQERCYELRYHRVVVIEHGICRSLSQDNMISYSLPITRCWFEISFIFTPTWGNDPICLFFFQMGGSTTNYFTSLLANQQLRRGQPWVLLHSTRDDQIANLWLWGAPSGGWSGSLDFFVIKFQDAGVGKCFFLEHFSGRWRSFFFVWTWRWLFFVYTHEI